MLFVFLLAPGGYTRREVRGGLHVVRRHNPQSHPYRRRLCVGGGLVPGHTDSRQQGRRAGIRGKDRIRGPPGPGVSREHGQGKYYHYTTLQRNIYIISYYHHITLNITMDILHYNVIFTLKKL